jgi:diguanylate cyclase (GGDEF)-like protein/PAS domain S-box-containing protein
VPGKTSKKTGEKLAQDALAHSRDLLLALSRAAQAIQRARTAGEVYHAVGGQIKLLGGDVTLFIFDEDCKFLILTHTTYDPTLLLRIEKMTGNNIIGYRLEFQRDSIYARTLDSGESQYIHWTRENISRGMSPSFHSMVGKFLNLMKVRQGILAPLCVDDEPLGLMIVSGVSLTESDVPAMESFAAQIATRLHTVRLTQQMQFDLFARSQTEETLRLQSAALEAAANAIAITDKHGVIQWVNPAWVKLTGYTREESVGHTPRIIKSETHGPAFYKTMWDTILAGQVWHGVMVNRRKDGAVYFEEQTITPVLDGNGNVTHFIAIKLDISQRRQAEAELQKTKEELEKANLELKSAFEHEQHLAQTDALTGINNRRYLFKLATHEFDIARRYGQPLSVVMFDLDHFKEVNDTFGHILGDRMLEHVAKFANTQLRDVDLIGRYGGEEFLIILPMTEARQALLLAERIRSGVEDLRVETEKGPVSVTLSVGISEIFRVPMDSSIDDIIRRADDALYAAKQAGRNRTVIFKVDETG